MDQFEYNLLELFLWWSKNMAPMGRVLFSIYKYILEKFWSSD